ncbi:hypothetical protein N7476_004720, partial [Penicillium atrosanguineum]
VRSLSQVSSRLHSAFIPLLYRKVKFRAASEFALNVIDIDTFFHLHQFSQDACYLQYVRELSIYAPIVLCRFNRCTYFNVFRSAADMRGISTLGTSNEAKAHEQFLDDMSRQLQLVQVRLKPHSLRSLQSSFILPSRLHSGFRWRLGTCLPPGFLDLGGYIDRYQNDLHHIALATDGSCPHSGNCLGGLSRLLSLKSVEWEGIQQRAELDILRSCILRNREHLVALSLGFIAPLATDNFYQDIFGVSLPDKSYNGSEYTPIYFPSLLTLSLSKAPLPRQLRPKGASMFGSLQSLTLRDCTSQLAFLDSFSCSQIAMQLLHFEFCSDGILDTYDDDRDLSPLVDFLLSLNGLKHLHLRLSDFTNTSQIQLAIEKHRPTLESFAYHERGLLPIDDEGVFEDIRDKTPAWLSCAPWTVRPYQLTALALSAGPSGLRSQLEPIARMSAIQVLHLRFSGSERTHRNIRAEIHTELSRKYQTRSNAASPDERFHQPASCSTSAADLSSRLGDHSYDSLIEHLDEFFISDKPSAPISEAEEFVDFADWAFGSKGLPALQILAFGDFSFEDRYQNQQFLMHRKCVNRTSTGKTCQGPFSDNTNDRNFCVADLVDPSCWDSSQVNGSNFLSICPESGLMDSPFE